MPRLIEMPIGTEMENVVANPSYERSMSIEIMNQDDWAMIASQSVMVPFGNQGALMVSSYTVRNWTSNHGSRLGKIANAVVETLRHNSFEIWDMTRIIFYPPME